MEIFLVVDSRNSINYDEINKEFLWNEITLSESDAFW